MSGVQERTERNTAPFGISKIAECRIQEVITLVNELNHANLSGQAADKGFLKPFSEDEYRKLAQDAEHFYVLLDKKVMGFVLAHSGRQLREAHGEIYQYIFHENLDAPFIMVRQIAIAPSLMGKGYARKLYEYLFTRIRAENPQCKKAVCYIWKKPHNKASEDFHRSLGWQETDSYVFKDSGHIAGIWEYRLDTDVK